MPQIVDALSPLPVVAAGGITDGRGLAAALLFGAAGVNIGTRFLASVEASLGEDWKRRLVETPVDGTVRFDASAAVVPGDELSPGQPLGRGLCIRPGRGRHRVGRDRSGHRPRPRSGRGAGAGPGIGAGGRDAPSGLNGVSTTRWSEAPCGAPRSLLIDARFVVQAACQGNGPASFHHVNSFPKSPEASAPMAIMSRPGLVHRATAVPSAR